MTTDPCELCGAESFMDFHCLLPSFNRVLNAKICRRCFEGADHDMALAVAVVKQRADKRKILLPVSMVEAVDLIDGGP